jgi:hypothetical protein
MISVYLLFHFAVMGADDIQFFLFYSYQRLYRCLSRISCISVRPTLLAMPRIHLAFIIWCNCRSGREKEPMPSHDFRQLKNLIYSYLGESAIGVS